MTKDQFQYETNDFMTPDASVAQAKADEYNKIGVDGDTIVAVQFGGTWCVMLKGAHDFISGWGL